MARVANISFTGAANVVPVRAMHWQRVTPVVLAKLEAVSVGTHMSLQSELPTFSSCPQCVLPPLQINNNSVRFYSDKEPLTKKLITERVLLVLKLYDKIDATKVQRR